MLTEDVRILIGGFIIINIWDNMAWQFKLKLCNQTKLGLILDATGTNFVSQLLSFLCLT